MPPEYRRIKVRELTRKEVPIIKDTAFKICNHSKKEWLKQILLKKDLDPRYKLLTIRDYVFGIPEVVGLDLPLKERIFRYVLGMLLKEIRSEGKNVANPWKLQADYEILCDLIRSMGFSDKMGRLLIGHYNLLSSDKRPIMVDNIKYLAEIIEEYQISPEAVEQRFGDMSVLNSDKRAISRLCLTSLLTELECNSKIVDFYLKKTTPKHVSENPYDFRTILYAEQLEVIKNIDVLRTEFGASTTRWVINRIAKTDSISELYGQRFTDLLAELRKELEEEQKQIAAEEERKEELNNIRNHPLYTGLAQFGLELATIKEILIRLQSVVRDWGPVVNNLKFMVEYCTENFYVNQQKELQQAILLDPLILNDENKTLALLNRVAKLDMITKIKPLQIKTPKADGMEIFKQGVQLMVDNGFNIFSAKPLIGMAYTRKINILDNFVRTQQVRTRQYPALAQLNDGKMRKLGEKILQVMDNAKLLIDHGKQEPCISLVSKSPNTAKTTNGLITIEIVRTMLEEASKLRGK